jgi:hypothetical protein
MKRFICVSIVLFGLLSSVAALDVPVNLIDTMKSMIDRSVPDIPKSAQRIDDTTLIIPLINSPNEGGSIGYLRWRITRSVPCLIGLEAVTRK